MVTTLRNLSTPSTDAAVVVLHRRESAPGWPELGMEDTMGCRGDPSGRRNTAGSWERRVDRLGELGCSGRGTEWLSIGKSPVEGAVKSLVKSAEVVHRGRIRSRTSDSCASAYSRSTLSARQGQHTVLFGTGSVRRFIIRSFSWLQSVPQAWQVRPVALRLRCYVGLVLSFCFAFVFVFPCWVCGEGVSDMGHGIAGGCLHWVVFF